MPSRDEVIPLAHGRRLFDAAPPPKTFVELKAVMATRSTSIPPDTSAASENFLLH